MTSVDSHFWALEDGFDTPLCDLPDALRQRVERGFPPVPREILAYRLRRIVAPPASADSRPS